MSLGSAFIDSPRAASFLDRYLSSVAITSSYSPQISLPVSRRSPFISFASSSRRARQKRGRSPPSHSLRSTLLRESSRLYQYNLVYIDKLTRSLPSPLHLNLACNATRWTLLPLAPHSTRSLSALSRSLLLPNMFTTLRTPISRVGARVSLIIAPHREGGAGGADGACALVLVVSPGLQPLTRFGDDGFNRPSRAPLAPRATWRA